MSLKRCAKDFGFSSEDSEELCKERRDIIIMRR